MTKKLPQSLVLEDAWQGLQQHTPARIALGHTGVSLPTRQVLDFSRAHALARDAVHQDLDRRVLREALQDLNLPQIYTRSAAPHRAAYLKRPDWGRRLHAQAAPPELEQGCDVLLVVADGLSAQAVHRHAPALLRCLLPQLQGVVLGPLVIVEQGRVAIADDIGQRLRARLSVIVIGERPGLSAPDSLGAYLTFAPQVGKTDEQRNCISNIRPAGLAYAQAAEQLAALIRQALGAQCSGLALAESSKAAAAMADPVRAS